MVELKVLGLAIDSNLKIPILVLKGIDKDVVLPIWVGGIEAMAISVALHNIEPDRPLTHDLFANVLKGLSAQVTSVTITDIREGVFYASLEVLQNNKIVEFDCRPSDAIAIALRTQATIKATDAVLEKAPLDRFNNAVFAGGVVHDEAISIVQKSIKAKSDKGENSDVSKDGFIEGFDGQEDILGKLLKDLEPASNKKM